MVSNPFRRTLFPWREHVAVGGGVPLDPREEKNSQKGQGRKYNTRRQCSSNARITCLHERLIEKLSSCQDEKETVSKTRDKNKWLRLVISIMLLSVFIRTRSM